jgi:hypothetical protein
MGLRLFLPAFVLNDEVIVMWRVIVISFLLRFSFQWPVKVLVDRLAVFASSASAVNKIWIHPFRVSMVRDAKHTLFFITQLWLVKVRHDRIRNAHDSYVSLCSFPPSAKFLESKM